MFKRLIRLAALAAIASAVATAVKMATQGAPERHAADAGGAGSVDTWPEVPRNPESP
ncbi:MAG TPA: hypothetical protein VGZ33_05640 [Acidimicrobiales bacterium]|jgi:hypothetical protein|nr:hypothetical protein [Acidimicrobiales bacterium]